MTLQTRDRAKGMFWGLVIGDCLGSPIQFTPKYAHRHITEMEPCDIFGCPPGYWTDDSSMAFCVAESVINRRGYDLKDIGNEFLAWFFNGKWSSLERAFDVGEATTDAMFGIRSGKYRNGSEERQGNGSVMRMAPVFLLAETLGRPEILDEVSDLTHDSKAVRQTVRRLADILRAHLSGTRTPFASMYADAESCNNSGWAVSTVETSLWAFNSTRSFEDALIAAVNLGGDADSIGAVCGQIAGAYYGFSAVPRRWLEAVKDWRQVDAFIDRFLDTLDTLKNA